MKDLSKAKSIISDDGFKIYYWTVKKNLKKPFVVLCHGYGSNHSSLQKISDYYNKKGHPTLLFDARAQGFSQMPKKKENYSLQKFTSDMKKILDKEKIKKPIFVTHSYSFLPVVNYAYETKNVRKIVGICTSDCLSESAPHPLLFQVFNKYLRFLTFAAAFPINLWCYLKGSFVSDYYNINGKGDFALFVDVLKIPLNKLYPSHIMGAREVVSWNVRKQLKSLNVPVILVHAKNDFMVPCKVQKKMLSYLKKGRGKILKGGHALPTTNPKEVFEEIY
jgi:pimeloyl-ACP methyl ester carboxylesterase